MIRKIEDEKAKEVKNIHNHFFNRMEEIMKKNQFAVEDIFGAIKIKDSILPYQTTKLNTFLAKKMWRLIFV